MGDEAKNSWEKGDEEVGRWEMSEKSWEIGDEENFGSREMGFPIYRLISDYINLTSLDLCDSGFV